MTYSPEEINTFIGLYSANLIPLRVVLASLTWVIYDYFETLEDEIRYIWTQKFGIGKFAYLFIRYYTILLLVFDTVQVHIFAVPGVTSRQVCLIMDPTIRVVGAISLWAIEIVMQLRVYALFNCSRKVAIFNGALFTLSIAAFVVLLVRGSIGRAEIIADAMRFPLLGCPAINHGPGKWAQWIPATVFEVFLLGFVVYKSIGALSMRAHLKVRASLNEDYGPPRTKQPHDNEVHPVVWLRVRSDLRHLIVRRSSHLFHRRPFHAAMGIMTTRMLMHLKKTATKAQFYDELPFSQCKVDTVLIDLAFAKLAGSENSGESESETETDFEAPPQSLDLERGTSKHAPVALAWTRIVASHQTVACVQYL
ncbi:hypothetical protein FA13DRAFT_1745593 [Coprinellus micaceus]|uniref:DUF6533 domain-containing protein n=1 Tax=Coprinellus micaceus TaxID=71717 RepID=A0A4Y7SCI6_COPMI|nr:hypothetical protein FA13DRAFT_1745593 [Coprinellus micaceus]